MTNEEALNAITAFVENYACGSDLDGLREAIEALKERPHGEWLPKYDDNGGRRYVCSICGEPCYTLLWTEPEPRDRFCLWCGADMREESERILDETVDGEGKDGNVKEGEAK